MAIADEKYMLFTTFRRDGRPVGTPVWLAALPGGEIGFYTGSQSGKAKRIRHTPRVTMQGCDSRGKNLHGPVVEGTARLVSGADYEQVNAAIRAKYGVMVPIARIFATAAARLRGQRFEYGDTGVVITPATSAV